MLRSVILENFVGFKTKQCVRFPENESPSIFVGENSSGKSSLLEGIRRCLTSTRSTTRSSAYDDGSPSYFICHYDIRKCDESLKRNGDTLFSGITTAIKENDKRYLKFVSTQSELLIDEHTADAGHVHHRRVNNPNCFDEIKKCFWDETHFLTNEIITECFTTDTEVDEVTDNSLEEVLEMLEKYIAMTLPLRSIGPLQWSKSDRIAPSEREKNYLEASNRAEIIKYFLTNEDEFDIDKEHAYFTDLTRQGDIAFKLSQDKNRIVVESKEAKLPGGEYAFLKTPEGILEAKYFSILMSSKLCLTIVLEEPDRGMHPQMIERMLWIMRKDKDKQIVLTTHNPCFVRYTTVPQLIVFKRIKQTDKNEKVQTKAISGKEVVNLARPQSGMKRLRILTKDHLSDLFFAERVVFCEGDSECLFLTALKEHIMKTSVGVSNVLKLIHGNPNTQQLDDSEANLRNSILSLQISNLNGWTNACLMNQVCKTLDLDHSFIFDKDAIIDKNGKMRAQSWLNPEYENIQQRFNNDENWENARRDLRAMNVFVWNYGTIEDMLIALLRTDTSRTESAKRPRYDKLVSWDEKTGVIQKLEKEYVRLPISKWKEQRPVYKDYSDTAAEKLFLAKTIKQENITASVELFLNACDDRTDDLVQLIEFLVPGGLAPSTINDPIPSTSGECFMELGSQE